MSYIHIRKGRIRGSLPKQYFPRNKELHKNDDDYHQVGDNSKGIEKVFLRSNTPQNFLWPNLSKAVSDSNVQNHLQPQASRAQSVRKDTDFSSFCFMRPDYSPPSKNSSCDVEIDCSAHDIQNVDDVITSLPSEQDERDKIQWRAVPSLQEIWREERARMKKLLSPELTQEIVGSINSDGGLVEGKEGDLENPTTLTLDVKKNAPRSGTKLATKGMWSLVNVSGGLQEEFLRALIDILERHKSSIEKADEQLQEGLEEKEKSHREENEVLDKLPAYSSPSRNLSTDSNSLTWHKAENIDSERKNRVRSFNRYSQYSSSIFEVEENSYHLQDGTQIFSQPLSYSCTQDMHERTLPTTLNPAEFSQRMDRGDSMLYTQDQDMDDLIDSDTLAPYDRIAFGEECCRATFVVDTDLPNMRRICGFSSHLCPREGHEVVENRAKAGMYRTITSGIIVDGLVDVSKSDGDGSGGDEDCDVLEDYFRRSQKCIDSEPKILTQSTQIPIATRLASTLLTQAIDEEPSLDNFGTVSLAISDPVLHDKCDILVSSEAPTRTQKRSLKDSYSQEREQIESRYDFFPEEDNDRIPHWLTSSSNIKKSNSKKVSTRDKCRSRKNAVENPCFEMLLRAPSLRDVKTWTRKRKQNSTETKTESIRKKKSANQMDDMKKRKDGHHSTRAAQNHDGNIHAEREECSGPKHLEVAMTPDNPKQRGSSEKWLQNGDANTPESSSEGRNSLRSSSMHSQIKSDSQDSQNALDGICNQGGRLFVQGGGGLKAKTRASNKNGSGDPSIRNKSIGSENRTSFLASPITMMAVEVHIQTRVGTSRLDSKNISMAQDSSKDSISALTYVFARDQGGGESIEVLSRGCICLTLDGENPTKDPKINKNVRMQLLRAMPRASMGVRSPLSIDVVKDERHLLRRFKDIVRMKDPDLMLSWDTQGAGLGYIIERGHALGTTSSSTGGESNRTELNGLDMAKLLGRTPMDKKAANFISTISAGVSKELDLDQINETNENAVQTWQGSGLGSDWDDRVGAGVAAASIVGRLIFSGWKIVAEEVKHANASYLPAVVFAVLNKRIPHHDDLILTKWYASGPDRWRTLSHRLNQATASLLLFDTLDIIGRAGEAARLSGVEFSQSFPGIRGSQYKVEGVLLRALQSLNSDERGSKKGKKAKSDFYTQQTNYSTGSGRTKSQSQSPWKVRRSNMEKEKIHLLKDRQYFFFSPSQDDIKEQEALEVQALTLEPQSGHFTDPVVVCDFTALYPSLVIAYNLCYSTCAGKLDYHSTRGEMQMEGKTRGKIGPFSYSERRTATVLNDHLKSLSIMSQKNNRSTKTANFTRDRAYVAPTGTIYVSESVLKGVLPQVLDEMLTTRAMLKKAAKEYKKNVKDLSPAVLRQLEARQLALKYVANVTYGYTSATFSGRCAMPLLADTIVECGRRTLQRAMYLASQWGQGIDPWGRKDNNWLGAEVIYGDTDSLFIRMPGRSYKEAFEFGEEFCKAVTSLNPPPVQLKLEKVYVGSIMQTMKRYCGMKFDSKDQKKPTFEAKGLEIIRRDQCALTQKVLKNALITLFKHGIQAVKEYMFRQWSLIFAGELPVSDFILTGRVRSKYRGGKEGPVQAVLARRLAEADPGRVVRHKQRLSYVIVATPGVTFRLKDCVLSPLELLERWDAYKIHSGYYIERHVNAALQRCLGLSPHFISVAEWFGACPKPRRRTHFWPIKSKRAMITAYFGNDVCSLCQRKCQADGSSLVVVCRSCRKDQISSIQSASATMNKIENEANTLAKKCSKCSGCFESADTFAVAIEQEQKPNTNASFRTLQQRQKNNQTLLIPLANCVCIDCPITYERHSLRERSIEAKGTYDLLMNDGNIS
jgi:DNA polymerase zeta